MVISYEKRWLGSRMFSGDLCNDVSEIMKYVNNITNEDELKTKYQKIFEVYSEEVPFIGIARSKVYVITNSYLHGDIKSKWYDLFFNFKDWYTS